VGQGGLRADSFARLVPEKKEVIHCVCHVQLIQKAVNASAVNRWIRGTYTSIFAKRSRPSASRDGQHSVMGRLRHWGKVACTG
jgi:hypothetical protein